MAVIRSSDIGTYLYCRRAWWYRRQGIESSNQAELSAGTELHKQHSRQVLSSSIKRTIALIVLMVGLTLLMAYCSARIL